MENKLSNIKVLDAISVGNQDFIVDQIQRLGTGNTQNLNIRLRDGSVVRWLCFRQNGDIAALCTEISLEDYPPGQKISWQGNEYRLNNIGSIKGIGTSSQGFDKFVTIEYKDYSTPGRWLFVNMQDQQVLVLEGEEISLGSLTIYVR